MRFLIRLLEQMDHFDVEQAIKLSLEIHKAESEGYELSKREEKYWTELTSLIEESK